MSDPTDAPVPSAEDRQEILYDEYNYFLYRSAAGEYQLEVLANQSAFYFLIAHVLTDDEVAAWKRRGKRSLNSLANRIRHEAFTR
jgi:hypothetical protein